MQGTDLEEDIITQIFTAGTELKWETEVVCDGKLLKSFWPWYSDSCVYRGVN